MRFTTFEQLEAFAEDHRGWLFRGQRDPAWNLESSLERASRRCGEPIDQFERTIVREFQRHAHTLVKHVPKDTNGFVEWLALMQHHGAPTRFLDFTTSFWIALYFAYEDSDSDCAVWALDNTTLGDRAADDFNLILKENIETGRYRCDKLYQDVPFFTNERLAIQKGTFVFSLNVQRPFHDVFVANEKVFKKVIVSKDLFPKIRRRLNDFNCNSRVLFPGIDGYARYFKNPEII
jgi:hypothetical protein